MELIRTTVSDNTLEGGNGLLLGGGVAADTAVITSSTISGNRALSDYGSWGGAVMVFADLSVLHSTITNNHAAGTRAKGGGVFSWQGAVEIVDSIVADNNSDDTSPDVRLALDSNTIHHSLIGDTSDLTPEQLAAINAGAGNLLDVDPLLGPLADNGGPQLPDGSVLLTHALLPGSPAIDAGTWRLWHHLIRTSGGITASWMATVTPCRGSTWERLSMPRLRRWAVTATSTELSTGSTICCGPSTSTTIQHWTHQVRR
ncbi:MAG: choice-of-anchor Q domain-containing protein [Pirellulales bacterium]